MATRQPVIWLVQTPSIKIFTYWLLHWFIHTIIWFLTFSNLLLRNISHTANHQEIQENMKLSIHTIAVVYCSMFLPLSLFTYTFASPLVLTILISNIAGKFWLICTWGRLVKYFSNVNHCVDHYSGKTAATGLRGTVCPSHNLTQSLISKGGG